MHILFVLEHYHPEIGGVETLFHSLVESCARSGHQCTVLTSRSSQDLPKFEQKENRTIHRISVPNRYLFTLCALGKVLKLGKSCDLIHTTSYNAALPAWIGAKLRKKKILITFHEVWGRLWFQLPFMGFFAKAFHFLFEQFLLALSFDRFIAPSQATTKRLEASGVDSSKIEQIYPGIEYTESLLARLPARQLAHFRFLYYGRLGISKGLNLLLPAFAKLHAEYPDARLKLIIPDTPKKIYRWITRYIRKHKLQDAVMIQSSLPFEELQQEIVNSDCVVIPSYSEGFCYTAVETMALGTPILSSDQGSLAEVVSGKCVKMEEQTADGVYRGMCRVCRGEWKELGEKRFELEESVTRHLELYTEI